MDFDRTTNQLAAAAYVCAACGFDHGESPCPAGRVGELLGGRYRLLAVRGVGGMGAVYEARHEVVGRRFAVKVLQADVLRRPSALTRFHREARAAGMLDSEHVAAVTDFGNTDDGVPFIVMEYLEGSDLARELARVGAMAPGRAAAIALQACRALAVAHAHGIVHRDLKPENLFLTRRSDGSELLKLLDFGIAKLQAGAEERATHTGVTLGTPHYMSPEQAQGQRDLDQRTDVYSLGAVLYEMLTGALAHPGSSPHEVLYHVTSRVPQPLSELRPDLPADLVAVVERAMAGDPDHRYASAGALAAALEPHAGRAAPPPAAAAARASSLSTDELLRRSGWRASPRRALLALAALSLLAASAAAWWSGQGGTAHGERATGEAAPAASHTPAPSRELVEKEPPEAPATQAAVADPSVEPGGVPEPEPQVAPASKAPRIRTAGAEAAAQRSRAKPRASQARPRPPKPRRAEPAAPAVTAPSGPTQGDAPPTLRRSRI